MSLNSLQDDMSRRAASMAAMAKRATNPQQIEAIQKSLVAGVQSGAIQPYVGIPLIQELTQKLTAAKAKMAQAVTGAGMPQPPQGGAPIAQQVMAQAAQESQGVEALPSNLPQSYAGGGIIAFEEGGPVERYQSVGYTGESERKRVEEAMAKLRTYGLRQRQQDPQGYIAAEAAAKEAQDALSNAERSITGGPVGAMGQSMGLAMPPAVAPTATPAISTVTAPSAAPGGPGAQIQPPPPAPPVAPTISGAGSFRMPTLPTMKETAAPVLTDLDALTKKLPADTKIATEDAITKTQKMYEDMDKPGFEAREGRLGKREAEQEKNSAVGRALNLISLGFGVAGSKERSLAGALGKEGREGIQSLIQGEAANRAAKDKLEDYRDNLEQQKVAAKKGNYQAAQAAGERAADNLYKYTSLNVNAASAGNSQAIQRQQIEQQSNFQQASLAQSGILGLSELGLRKDQLNQSAATANAQLQLGRERLSILKDQIAAGDKRAAAALATAEQKAYTAFQTSPQFQEAQAKAKKMAPIEAQRFMQQEWTKYSANAMPSLLAGQGGGANIPSFADAMKAME